MYMAVWSSKQFMNVTSILDKNNVHTHHAEYKSGSYEKQHVSCHTYPYLKINSPVPVSSRQGVFKI